MTKEEVKKHLENNETLGGGSWVFSKNCMNCGDGCCYQEFSGVEEALENIGWYVDLDELEVV